MKLVTKKRHGARLHKVYDTAQTPYQRLLKADILIEAKRQELAATYYALNPVTLLQQINESLEHLWTMAKYPGDRKGADPLASLRAAAHPHNDTKKYQSLFQA